MRRLLVTAGVTVALTMSAGAEISNTGVFGYWTTFAGAASDGSPICGMSTDWMRGAATIGSFMIKYFGGDHIAVHIGKAGWQVPEGEPVTVLMQIDRAPAMRAQGYGVSLGGVSGLEIRIDGNDTWAATGKNAITEFVSLLGTGRQIVVSFPDGTEVPWVGRLDGARAALKSFSACGETIDAAKAPGTTQPFGRAPQPAPGATQPFGRAPEPAPTTVTQPYHKL